MKTGAKGKICQAFLELADGKSAQDVTVSELIARAGINRSTFYYHFTGTHEVLEYMMDDFCAQYLSALMIPRGEVAKSISKSSQDALEKGVCDYIRKAGHVVPFFLQEPHYRLFAKHFRKAFQDYCQAHRIVQVFPDGHTEQLKRGVFYDYYVHMSCLRLFAVLECWAERNFSETEEDFVHIFDTLHNTSISFQG